MMLPTPERINRGRRLGNRVGQGNEVTMEDGARSEMVLPTDERRREQRLFAEIWKWRQRCQEIYTVVGYNYLFLPFWCNFVSTMLEFKGISELLADHFAIKLIKAVCI